MTPDLLRRTGEALYGPRWQSDLAHDLGVADRTVRRWIAGNEIPRPGVWSDLLAVLQTRQGILRQIEKELKRA